MERHAERGAERGAESGVARATRCSACSARAERTSWLLSVNCSGCPRSQPSNASDGMPSNSGWLPIKLSSSDVSNSVPSSSHPL